MDEQLLRRSDAIRLKDEGIKTLQVTLDSYREKCRMMEQQVEQNQNEMKVLQSDIEKRENFLLQGGVASQGLLEAQPSFVTGAGNKSTEACQTQSEETFVSVKIENEQLKKDNSLLVELLRSTKKFGDLAAYIKDSGGRASKMDSLDPPAPFNEHRRCYQGLLERKRMDEVFTS